MKQAVSGLTPSTLSEATIMTTWPSIGATSFGQTLGRLYMNRAGFGHILTVGNVIALLSIPQALLLYFMNLWPWTCRRFRLTNRRIVEEKGVRGKVEKEVSLDHFDSIDLVVHPGQEWYRCGDLVFMNGKIETFRLDGVPHPEGFRHTCLKAQRGYAGVSKAVGLRK